MSGSAVRVGIAAAIAFVVGIVAGGVGPRGDVRALEEKVFQLERDAARRGSEAGRELATLLTRGLDRSNEGSAAVFVPPDDDPEPALSDDAQDLLDDLEDAGPPPEGADRDPMASAREVLEVRATQARAALVEDIDPTDAQLDAIDRVLSDMNAELELVAEEVVARVSEGQEPGRREMMVVGADLLDVFVATEQRLLDVLDADQQAAVREEATDPTAFIDPSVVDIFMSAQDDGGGRGP